MIDFWPLAALGGFIVALGAIIWLARKNGQQSVLQAQAEGNKEIKNEQLQAVVDKPDSVDRLHSGTF